MGSSEMPEPQGLQQLLDALPFSAVLLDAERHLVAANPAAVEHLKLDADAIPGSLCPHLAQGRTEPIADCPLYGAVADQVPTEVSHLDPQTQQMASAGVYPTELTTANGDTVYLHLFPDMARYQADTKELCRSLEHHRALADLLQHLQRCTDSEELLQGLLDRLTEVSWLGVATKATAFVVEGNQLRMVAHRNIDDAQQRRCARVNVGECFCGRVAGSGARIVGASDDDMHEVRLTTAEPHEHTVLPLRYEDRTLGVLNLYLRPSDHLDEFRLEFLEAAANAAGTALAERLARESAQQARVALEATRRQLLERVMESQETERRRVARELHDQLGQSLSALLLEVDSSATEGDGCMQLRARLSSRINDMVEDVRRLAWELRPAILDDYGLEEALARHVEDVAQRAGLAVDYENTSGETASSRLAAREELALFRVAQEALTNVIRHAGASRVSVICVRDEARVRLLVEDDGGGFDYDAARQDTRASLGLAGMAERLQLCGGTLTVESTPGSGTTVRAEVPVDGWRAGTA